MQPHPLPRAPWQPSCLKEGRPLGTGALLRTLRAMHLEGPRWPLARLLPLATANPARLLRLPRKGRLAPGADADLLLLHPATLEVRYVVAGGEVVKTPEWVRGGMFERGPGIRPRRPSQHGGGS